MVRDPIRSAGTLERSRPPPASVLQPSLPPRQSAMGRKLEAGAGFPGKPSGVAAV